jgi:tRNA threonylcarbamoyladenosine biosynthesis protein TsaE
MVAMTVSLINVDMASDTITADLADEAATGRFAAKIAGVARRLDVIALWGDLGAGKTAFARGFLRALGVEEEVPSPTFTLVQSYLTGDVTVYHFDLYRIETVEEVYELGIEDAFADGISLIEWPDRLAALLPADRLDISLEILPSGRRARVTAHQSWIDRVPSGLADD